MRTAPATCASTDRTRAARTDRASGIRISSGSRTRSTNGRRAGGGCACWWSGAGGFTFGRGRPASAADIVYVDVDDRLGEVAGAFLGAPPWSGAYVAMDGRAYLLRDHAAFDAIVLDAYADRTTVPAHLVTRQFFALARSRLAEGGALYMNLIAPPEPERLATRIERTLRAVFAWCRTHVAGDASRWHNLVFACARSGLDGDAAVYSDGGPRGETDGLATRRRRP